MSVPLQSRFPRLWLFVQYVLCGVLFRKRYVLRHLPRFSRVMEVGCSLGLDSVNFTGNTKEFLGVDIDPDAIATARKRFAAYPHMRFICQDVRTLEGLEGHFDFILFCGSCHHIPNEELISIFRSTPRYLAENGKIVVIDYATNPAPGLLERFILRLEEGEHVRTTQELISLIQSAGNLEIQELVEFDNPAFIFKWPVMGRKLSLVMTRSR
ncbi:class I SAM-dependent methyltransferase [Fundidesulfovibrio terrae]|uniref:class I SAM-dependent methyltransferase n=1 Tax=Fundidesulfovibrio terrae TaxID=2922866 RepID=UPI0024347FD6|nr:class I SAM-dependent methyltransferase [Fundidesulfovibrio terrae]